MNKRSRSEQVTLPSNERVWCTIEDSLNASGEVFVSMLRDARDQNNRPVSDADREWIRRQLNVA
jgi:hypothetical protein